jgi:two-component system, LytTR family, sensor kinase
MPKFTSSRWFILGIQILIWVAFLLLPISIDRPENGLRNGSLPIPAFAQSTNFIALMLCTNIVLILYFYLNFYYIIPQYLIKKGIKQYFLLLLILSIIWISAITPTLQWIFDINIALPMFNKFKLMPFIFITAISLAARLTVDRIQEEKRVKESENETLKSELSFLRSQISPHFLLNVMNTVVSFSRRKPHLVEPTLIELSQIIRYMLYEKEGVKVEIEKEITYLESYIHLQKMRFGDVIRINFEKNALNIHNPDASGTEGVLIEPMLLIPFVENAFKHGSGMINEPFIDINLHLENKVLRFNVANKFNPNSTETKDDNSGIGLKNIQRRLDLLYEKKHNLSIKNDTTLFEIDLKIDLK